MKSFIYVFVRYTRPNSCRAGLKTSPRSAPHLKFLYFPNKLKETFKSSSVSNAAAESCRGYLLTDVLLVPLANSRNGFSTRLPAREKRAFPMTATVVCSSFRCVFYLLVMPFPSFQCSFLNTTTFLSSLSGFCCLAKRHFVM